MCRIAAVKHLADCAKLSIGRPLILDAFDVVALFLAAETGFDSALVGCCSRCATMSMAITVPATNGPTRLLRQRRQASSTACDVLPQCANFL